MPPTAPAGVTAPNTKELETKGPAIVTQMRAITIVKTRDDYGKASNLKDAADALLKEISETFDANIKAAHALHKSLIASKKKFSEPVESALGHMRRAMGAFEQEQERIRLAEQAKLQEQARKDHETLAVATAAQLELQGQPEAAEEVLESAINGPGPTVVLEKFDPNEYGRSSRTVWKWRFVDLNKLKVMYLSVQKGANGQETELSTAGIGALVRTLKNKEAAEATIGGIEVWSEISTS